MGFLSLPLISSPFDYFPTGTGFENWLTDVKPPPRRRSRKKGSTFGVDEGGDDLFGWRRDLPPFSSGPKFSFEDDFLWLFSAPPKR
jgi:hypothetical protein